MANTKITTAVIKDDAITTAKIADDAVTGALIADDVALAGNPTTTTQSAGNNTTRIATTAFVTTAINNLVDSAPSALDTLNELAAAMGDDANFSTTITNSVATKAPLAGPTFTGDVDIDATDDLRLRFLRGSTFKAGIQVPTSTDDMISGAAIDDLAIRSQANVLFASGGNTERMRIDSNGNAIFTKSGGAYLQLKDASAVRGSINVTTSDGLVFTTGASFSEAMRIDSSGNLLIGGGTSPRTLGFGDTRTQIEGISATTASMSIVRNTASGDPPYLIFGKSRGGALASSTIVQDGDYLGAIRFNGADGTDAGNVGAQIHAEVDGTPGANDMPGALVFSTTADGAASATERMRVATDGTTTIGRSITTTYTNSQGYPLHIQASGGSQTYLSISVPGDNSGDTGVVIGHDASGTRIVNRENQPILFHTGSSSGLTFTMEAGGDLSIADGNLVVASGHGIDFSATGNSSGSMSSELLDDYEEGSWTPVLTAASSAPTVSLTHVSGYYVKIGNLVYVRFGMYLGSISGGSGAVRISGLPYAGKTYGSYRQPAALANAQNLTSDPDGPVIFFLLDGDTKLEGRLFNNADTAVPISHFQANSWCIANLSYDVS